MLIGITLEGEGEVIDYRLYPTESVDRCEEMLRDVRAGAEEALMAVTDPMGGDGRPLRTMTAPAM